MQSPQTKVDGKSSLMPWLVVAGFAALLVGELVLARQVQELRIERTQLVANLEAANGQIQEFNERLSAVATNEMGSTATIASSTLNGASARVSLPAMEARIAELEQKIESATPVSVSASRTIARAMQPAKTKIAEYNVNNPPPPEEIPPPEEPKPQIVDSGMRGWGEEQVVGAPNADGNGDNAMSWASQNPDAGPEWLSLAFEKPVDVAEVRIRENHNPGAIARVTAVVNGQEVTLWEGTAQRATDSRDFVVPVNGNIRSGSIIVHMDTTRVPGWNEIDAVELIGRDGSRQWAVNSEASSTYAQPRTAQTETPPGQGQRILGVDYLNR